MNEKFTYYIFYIRNEYLNMIPLPYFEIKDRIYAYTDDKKIARSFLQSRSRKIFRMKKKILSRTEVNFLCSKHPNSYILLKTVKTHINTKILDYNLVLTKSELIICQHECDSLFVKVISHSQFSPHIIDNKYMEAFKKLKYDAMHIYYFYGENGGHNYSDYENINELGTPDYLTIFISLYGNLLSLKGE